MKKEFWKSCFILHMFVALLCEGNKLNEYFKQRNFQCNPIQEKLCSGIGYNFTTMPNIMGNENQKEASRRFREFQTLMNYQYSEKFHFFLCTLFFPMCTDEVNIGIPACRPLCEDMRSERAPIMQAFGFKWSDSIDCSKLPWESLENHLCIPHPSYMGDGKENQDNLPLDGIDDKNVGNDSVSKESRHTWNIVDKSHEAAYHNSVDDENSKIIKQTNADYKTKKNSINYPILNTKHLTNMMHDPAKGRKKHKSDVETLQTDDSKTFSNRFTPEDQGKKIKEIRCANPGKFIYFKRSESCQPRCGPDVDVFFSSDDKNFVFLVSSTASSLCFVSTVFTMATFLVDSRRFRYPERPVVFVALSYCAYSIGYLMRSVRGIYYPFSCVHNETLSADHIVTSGSKDTTCYASFFILYFFQMAGSAWWVVLNVTWLLSAAFKWGHEAIEAIGFYFHVAAWTVPALQTVSVLLQSKVDGDELTGLCNVGNLDPDSLMYYVIIPLALYLLIGTVTLLFGFSYLFKIRRVIKREHGKEAIKLEKLMLKIGLFTVLYAVPMACIIAVNFLQFRNFSKWVKDAEKNLCIDLEKKTFQKMHLSNEQKRSSLKASYIFPVDEDYDLKLNNNDMYIFNDDIDSTSNVQISSSINENLYPNQKELSIPFNSNMNTFTNCHLLWSVANVSIFVCRIIMSLIPGILTGMWIGSTKTAYSWMKFFKYFKARKIQSSLSNKKRRNKLKIENVAADKHVQLFKKQSGGFRQLDKNTFDHTMKNCSNKENDTGSLYRLLSCFDINSSLHCNSEHNNKTKPHVTNQSNQTRVSNYRTSQYCLAHSNELNKSQFFVKNDSNFCTNRQDERFVVF